MLRKKDLYKRVVFLRNEGSTYGEILEKIDFKVSNSTLSRWCFNINLTQAQKERIKEKQRNFKLIKFLIENAKADEERAKSWAEEKMKLIPENDFQFLLLSGIMLYWAEGYNSIGKSAGFTNTDPKMIELIMEFFRKVLEVDDKKIRIMIRIEKRNDVNKAMDYWSGITKLPLSSFYKSEILETKRNRYPNGMCRVTIHDVSARRKINNLLNLIKNNRAPVAQRIEQHTPKVKVTGSTPVGGTINI